MSKKSKTIISVFILLISISIAFVAGVNLGFSDGYSLLSNLRCTQNANYYANTLKSLRENKVEDVIKLMEIKLDGAIIEHSVANKPSFAFALVPISYLFEFDDKKDLKFFKKAIEYREQYPSSQENVEIRNTVHSHLKEIEAEIEKNRHNNSLKHDA